MTFIWQGRSWAAEWGVVTMGMATSSDPILGLERPR